VIEKINISRCTCCGICIDVCPMDVLRMDNKNHKVKIMYPNDCITCFNCELECPSKAIYVSPTRTKSIVFPW
jgi:NAD-dependent dihydropyrimidine dehydrogenase PreA subunit